MKTIVFIFCLAAFGCSQHAPAPPACRIAPEFITEYKGSAACLIRVKDTLLTLQDRHSGSYDLPRGSALDNESAQCTAHRNTFIKTGFNVEVSQLLGISPSGEWIFACTLDNGFDSSEDVIIPPNWVDKDVASIRFIDPFATRGNQWQEADDLIVFRDGYVALGHVPFVSLEERPAVAQ